MKRPGHKSRWKEWQIYLGYFLICLFFVSIGTYSVIDAVNVLETQNRTFHIEKLKYKRSPERRIVKGTFFGLLGTILGPIYAWLLVKELQNRGRRFNVPPLNHRLHRTLRKATRW